MLASDPVCPAALKIAGACASQQGVICRIMQDDQQDDPGLRMNPRQLEVLRESEGGVFITVKSDPSTVTAFCYGDAVPVVTNDDGQGRASYSFCPTWQEARDRHLAGLDGLTEEPELETVSMGVEEVDGGPWASHEADNPWAAGRQALDELAGV